MEINVSEKKYNRRLGKLAKQLPTGATLYNVDPMVFNPNMQDSAWYTWGGVNVIARIDYKGHLFTLACNGDMRIEVGDHTVRYGDDLSDINVYTDDDIANLPISAWINNSWFEYWTPCHQDGVVTESYGALESIREMINNLDEMTAWCKENPTQCASAREIA